MRLLSQIVSLSLALSIAAPSALAADVVALRSNDPRVMSSQGTSQTRYAARQRIREQKQRAAVRRGRGPSAKNPLVENGLTFGNANAPITIVAFTDLECPACVNFWKTTFTELQRLYIKKNLVRMVIRHFPLTEIHPAAQALAETVECAQEQGNGVALSVFENIIERPELSIDADDASALADDVRDLHSNRFDECIESGRGTKAVALDVAAGESVPVYGTPTFIFVNAAGKIVGGIEGGYGSDVFIEVLDGLLD